MILRKVLPVIIASSLALSMLTACSANSYDGKDLDRDINKHWVLSENGKKHKASKHNLADNICSVCESEILKNDDGTVDINNFNENGDLSRVTSYDADGNVISDAKYEYEYDPDGNMFKHKKYEFDVLVEEFDYYVESDGQSIISKQTFYYEDGTKLIHECDGKGNIVNDIFCDVNGMEWITNEYSYTYLSEDDFFLSTKVEYLDDGSKYVFDYNTFGDTIHWYTIDPYGSSISDIHYEYDYDDEGNMTYSNQYNGSYLEYEYEYALDAEGNEYCVKETIYNYDESVTYIEYNENMDITSNTTNDASGNIIG